MDTTVVKVNLRASTKFQEQMFEDTKKKKDRQYKGHKNKQWLTNSCADSFRLSNMYMWPISDWLCKLHKRVHSTRSRK